MLDTIFNIASKNPSGFTYSIVDNTFVENGFVVGYEATQNSFGLLGLFKSVEHAENHDQIVGGWENEDDGRYSFDSNKVFDDKKEAIEFGIQQKQEAIYD